MVWYPNMGMSISPIAATGILKAREAYLTARNWPYGYTTNIGGELVNGCFDTDIPYHQAVAQNIMMNNPFYYPYIPLDNMSAGGNLSEIDTAKAQLAAYKDILKIEYEYLGKDIDGLLSNIDSALGAEGLTDGQKTALEQAKEKLNALKQKREDFAKNSADKDVQDALKELNGLKGEYRKIRDDVAGINNKIQSGQEVRPELTPEQVKEQYEGQTKPAIDEMLNNPKVSDEDKKAIQDKQKELEQAIAEGKPKEELNKLNNELLDLVDNVNKKLNSQSGADETGNSDATGNNDAVGNNSPDANNSSSVSNTPVENMSVDDIKKEMDDTVKPAIDKIENSPYLSDEDKKAIADKQKEIEDAIKNNKPESEIKEKYKELRDLVDTANNKISEAKTAAEDKEVKALNDVAAEVEKLGNEIGTSPLAKGNELNEYMTPSDKNLLIQKLDALKAAAKSDKSAAEIKQALEDVKKTMAEVEQRAKDAAKKDIEEASDIAGKIYNAAHGVDFNIFGDSENEKIIKEYVNKINRKNVIRVLRAWQNGGYNDGDQCMLDTIASEFSSEKTINSLLDHIIDAIEQHIKDKNMDPDSTIYNRLEKVRGKVHTAYDIFGDANEGYEEFRKILKEYFNISDDPKL